MNLVAYIDESGTHDETGRLKGSEAVAIGGLVSSEGDWIAFDKQWRRILKKYHDVEYFHFREQFAAWRVIALGEEASSDFEKNPYKGWSKDQLADFVLELAPLAASRVIVGGYVPTKLYHQDKIAGKVGRERHPYELCLDHLFNSYISTIKAQRPSWRGKPVSFLFDWTENDEWEETVTARCAFFGKQKIRKLSEFGFERKKEHTPLQAADMIAYRMRSNMEKLSKLEFSRTWPELDEILFKSINEWEAARSQDEKDAILRRHFEIPENVTYEQAMDAMIEESKLRHANKSKK